MVVHAATLGEVQEGTSGLPFLDCLVMLVWILSSHFRATIWVGYVDGQGDWSDGISPLFAADPFAAAHVVQIAPLEFEVAWY